MWRNARFAAAYGLIAVALCQFAYFNAVERLSVAVALLLEYLAPVLIVGYLWVRGARPGRLTLPRGGARPGRPAAGARRVRRRQAEPRGRAVGPRRRRRSRRLLPAVRSRARGVAPAAGPGVGRPRRRCGGPRHSRPPRRAPHASLVGRCPHRGPAGRVVGPGGRARRRRRRLRLLPGIVRCACSAPPWRPSSGSPRCSSRCCSPGCCSGSCPGCCSSPAAVLHLGGVVAVRLGERDRARAAGRVGEAAGPGFRVPAPSPRLLGVASARDVARLAVRQSVIDAVVLCPIGRRRRPSIRAAPRVEAHRTRTDRQIRLLCAVPRPA